MSELFPHRVLPAKTKGFVFVVVAEDEDVQDLIDGAAQAEKILNSKFETDANSGLTSEDARNPEEVDMVYADAVSLLEDNNFPLAECFIVTSVTVVGDLVVVVASLGDVDDEDEDDEELSEEDFE
ncbi:hypothetical protein JA33_007 [Dickeya phage vB_DsoM_JA33]|uniref:Uncharacterized protein n=2 Tax=Salmondvirus JA11 TaxID=2734141 RepID=A0A386K525_9CAUD|nr:hypothetical protein HOU32_gp007 [Dickeya phage vB_DsoM_JA11]AXG67381.1 hypothetical protein JA33_007 [Dickeya phage vB_DsoM_JA33]AYD79812.1 hypothetical protein JA11_007 [Dickeya phage vB_DsoM_JA11]